MEEIWKEIPNHEGYYMASNHGRIKSLKRERKGRNGYPCSVKERILKPKIDRYGYYVYGLSKNSKTKTFTCHRLVALAFLENKDNLPQINHINGNKLDNTVGNLEWCDNSHNMKEAFRLGLAKPRKSDQNVLSKKVAQIKDGQIIKIYNSVMDASVENGVVDTAISNCLNGRSRSSAGYQWKLI